VPSARVKGVIQHRARKGEEQTIEITINSKGYRGPEVQPKTSPSTFRVLCLGDSNFFGYPLDDRHAFPRALQESLSQLAPGQTVGVTNGGVPGYSIVQGRIFFDDLFAQHRWDVLLISFLNNDAWIQPLTDEENLRRQGSLPTRLVQLVGPSRIVQAAGRVAPRRKSPRVPLPLFLESYEDLVKTVESLGTRVLILDYRAYPEIQPYSEALRKLSGQLGVLYVPVAEWVDRALEQGGTEHAYPDLALRVRRRWGRLMEKRPYLSLYAEYYPEHLNEVGTAWLADQGPVSAGWS
jgi:lysophospholipase L1-like esterase